MLEKIDRRDRGSKEGEMMNYDNNFIKAASKELQQYGYTFAIEDWVRQEIQRIKDGTDKKRGASLMLRYMMEETDQ